jgi:hypothetical protein
MKQAIYMGVDVSKKQLDVAIRPLGQVFGVSNDRRESLSSSNGQRSCSRFASRSMRPVASKRNWRMHSLRRIFRWR